MPSVSETSESTRGKTVILESIPVAILVIFFVSGMSALIDQIVWTRALHRIFGATSLAASTVLAAFMTGLAIGSYYFGRLVDKLGSALRLYALVELAIAIIAPLTPWLFRALQPVYLSISRSVGLDSIWLPVLRGLLCMLVLLGPTVLMGATLPVLAKAYLRNAPGRTVSLLYSVNTWGAVVGCFLAGFVLLGVVGETGSLLLASCGNVAAAAWAWNMVKKHPSPDSQQPNVPEAERPKAAYSWTVSAVFFASFINGLAALALEVLWGRTLGLLTDASVYSYTAIIGMFLVGIALGSKIAGPFADRAKSPLQAAGYLIALLSATLVITVTGFIHLVPYEYFGGGGTDTGMLPNIWLPFRMMLLAALAVAPVTILSGACFPLFARLVLTEKGKEGRQLGSMYAINTLGGIVGAVLAGYVLLPTVYDQGSFCTIALLYSASAALCLGVGKRGTAAGLSGLATAALALILLPFGTSLSRSLASHYGEIYKHIESASGTVTAYTITTPSTPSLYRKQLRVNGTGMTVLCTDTKVMAHLPLMLHPDPKNILVVCFGMGTTFRSASLHNLPLTVVELQPKIPSLFGFFHSDADAILSKPQNHVRAGDGRNYLLLSREKYSVVTIDPAPPMYSAGTVNLYTKEFFTLCNDHLDPDGIMQLWIPGGSCLESDFRLIVKTFSTVFKDYTLWIGPNSFGWYLIGSQKPIIARPERLKMLTQNELVRKDLAEYLPDLVLTPETVRSMFISGKIGIDHYIINEPRVISDDMPYTEFPWLKWVQLGSSLGPEWMVNAKLKKLVEPPQPGRFPSANQSKNAASTE